ncbi:MAG TPA: crossover junction endodeoxyribonuclease RuvC [Zeimonas sp.]
MRILGIDPGLRVTGFGVIDVDGTRLRYVASGVIRIPAGSLPPRLKTIHDGIADVVAEYHPNSAVAEIVFVNVNPQSTLLLGQARGAAITALVARGLPVHEYTALQVKQAVVGYGRAAKSQVQQMVQRLLALPGVPSTDAADALACAICHAHAATMSAAAVAGTLTLPKQPSAAGRRVALRRGRMRLA